MAVGGAVAGDSDRSSTLDLGLETYAPELLQQEPDETIRPYDRVTGPNTDGRSAIASLLEDARREPSVSLGKTIGQGGMGVVYSAEQVSLGRAVAVKRLRPDNQSDNNVLALLREAWITGNLEHPNVVPVHDVGLDEEGQPYLVMKRIEGEHWGTLIRDDDVVRERYGATDVTAWHLGVLMQVCNAVRFAHDRGVLHRDLKPENVMVGAFGEVYLMDWGVAVALEDDRGGRLPLASRVRSIAGTPAYMAPEMVQGMELGVFTDVYLLGSVLYEILAKRPPHRGVDTHATMAALLMSSPPEPPGPPDLVALCMQALSHDPAARPQDAGAFRRALQDHLERRGAARLAEEAESLLAQLLVDLNEPRTSPEIVARRFGEVRFGFRQALRTWPEHAAAREGLSRAVMAMAEWEMSRGDPHAAAHLLAEPDTVIEPGLASMVRQEVDRIDKALADRDPFRGLRSRWAVAVFLGVIWTLQPAMNWWFGSEAEFSRSIRTDGSFAVVVLVLGVIFRKELGRTSFNRRTWAILQAAPLCNVLMAWGSWELGVPIEAYLVYQLFIWMLLSFSAVLMIEWRLWPAPLAYLVAFLIAARHPAATDLVSAIGNGALTACLAVVWWPGWRDRA